MSTGKTFITKAFAKESGLAAIQLKNFRDKWVGSTEANLEKVLDVITAIGEIIVIIDEGDRSLGGAEGDGRGQQPRDGQTQGVHVGYRASWSHHLLYDD